MVYDFLDNNPSETVIVTIKEDYGSAGDEFALCLFNDYISKNKDKWYLENKIPTLGEVRGKIVLAYRHSLEGIEGFTDKNSGMNFSSWTDQGDEQTIHDTFDMKSIDTEYSIAKVSIQDRYKLDKDKKWNEAVLSMLDDDLNTDELNINFLSTSSGLSPRNNAKEINNNFLNYTMDHNKYYGIIVVDFGDSNIAKKIYSCNENIVNHNTKALSTIKISLDKVQKGLPLSVLILGICFVVLLSIYVIKRYKGKR